MSVRVRWLLALAVVVGVVAWGIARRSTDPGAPGSEADVPRPGELIVRGADESGRPLVGARIVLRHRPRGRSEWSEVTALTLDENGRAVHPDAPLGEWSAVPQSGGTVLTWRYAFRFAASQSVESEPVLLESPTDAGVLRIVAPSAGGLRVRYAIDPDDRVLPFVTLRHRTLAHRWAAFPLELHPAFSDTVDAAGRSVSRQLDWPALPIGRYQVLVRSTVRAAQAVECDVTGREPAVVTVPLGAPLGGPVLQFDGEEPKIDFSLGRWDGAEVPDVAWGTLMRGDALEVNGVHPGRCLLLLRSRAQALAFDYRGGRERVTIVPPRLPTSGSTVTVMVRAGADVAHRLCVALAEGPEALVGERWLRFGRSGALGAVFRNVADGVHSVFVFDGVFLVYYGFAGSPVHRVVDVSGSDVRVEIGL